MYCRLDEPWLGFSKSELLKDKELLTTLETDFSSSDDSFDAKLNFDIRLPAHHLLENRLVDSLFGQLREVDFHMRLGSHVS